MSSLEYFLLIIPVLWVVYRFITRNHDWFQKRGIPFFEPVPIFGNFLPLALRKIIWYDFSLKYYKLAKEKGLGGMFQMNRPILIIGDMELVKKCTIKDFDHFTDHWNISHEDDIISKSLFSKKGQKWKDLRSALSPAFTSSKMRIMFELINKCGEQIDLFLKKQYKKGLEASSDPKNYLYEHEMKDLFTRFTNDAIATSAFGIEVDSLAEPKNEFYLMGKKLTDFSSFIKSIRFSVAQISPKLLKIFWPNGLLDIEPITFLNNIVQKSIDHRRKNGIIRPDMIHLMMETNKSNVTNGDVSTKSNHTRLTDDDIKIQSILFFFGGFDTIANSLALLSHLIAQFPDVQKKLHQEIDEILEKSQGNITYELIMKEMPYMEMVFNESQRYYPQAPFIERVCVKPYTFPAEEDRPAYTINVGEQIWIPAIGFHRDANIYPDPNNFIPERFNEENKGNIDPSAYMPFGAGPRMCIANRFAKMEAKVAMFHLLKNFEVTFCKKTDHPLKFINRGFSIMTKSGFWLGFKPRKEISLTSKQTEKINR